jgi:hypothetical protein
MERIVTLVKVKVGKGVGSSLGIEGRFDELDIGVMIQVLWSPRKLLHNTMYATM